MTPCRRLFICSSSRIRMPYLNGYKKALNKEGTVLLIWDRLGVELSEPNIIVYRDGKSGQRRGFIDHVKFAAFVFFKAPVKPKAVVFFGSPVFLFCFLRFCFGSKIYLDVRDWHSSWKWVPWIFKARLTKVFVSSPKFSTLLGVPDEIVTLSHNCWNDPQPFVPFDFEGSIRLSYIGSVRDLTLNLKLISSLRESKRITVVYHGDGSALETISEFVEHEAINNVQVKGEYEPKFEYECYRSATMVNSIVSPADLNSSVLLTNRLYNSVLNYRPLLALRGTYLSQVVQEYRLGLVVDDFDDLERKIVDYFSNFDCFVFKRQCEEFLKGVKEDMELFNIEVDLI